MTISLDSIGIWQDLGIISPEYNIFKSFPLVSSSDNEFFRIFILGDKTNIKSKCYIRQKLGDNYYGRWSKFYPNSGNQYLFITFPEILKGQGLDREFSLMKRSFYKNYLGSNRDSFYSVAVAQFIPFSISQPGLSDQEKAYLDQLLRQYIQESATNQTQYPPIL